MLATRQNGHIKTLQAQQAGDGSADGSGSENHVAHSPSLPCDGGRLPLRYVPLVPTPAELLDLSGRTIVVAGAGGGGIGTAVSGLLAAAGALVVGVDNRAEALDDFTAATNGVDGRPHPAVVGDMRDPATSNARSLLPGDELFGLVHVAGGMLSTPWIASPISDPLIFDD